MAAIVIITLHPSKQAPPSEASIQSRVGKKRLFNLQARSQKKKITQPGYK